MSSTRPAAVAGYFYPSDPIELATEIDTYLAQGAVPSEPIRPKALIVPHAGTVYSGPVAASAYRHLIPWRKQIHSVVLLGPSHHCAFKGIALPDCDSFATPLGTIEVDHRLADKLPDWVQSNALAHRDEHSLEVQLPFLQRVLDQFRILPLVIGNAATHEVEQLLARLLDAPDSLLLISTDLSHFHSYEEAQRIDADSSDRILALRPELSGQQACGCRGLNGLLALASKQELSIELLDRRNSGDTAGSRDRVVGYAAYVLH
ncbi:AmmeMemoRadiSam system protein B [Aestuariirhabdus sp. Z084]|uniref:AmmeMemoRadiSam system protein B n=1 Tax=Aestuariirhabdus haliotis TaxID=2918751 RepID=UPI00201B43C4|nr:AmmeMemoRadiSam system protein B [Aestuariirhabdus haliotis]MCL6417581.1 AmmeMemoRadiSam system protein B [Aestuariirhabdus haliotis]MCL6421515.1 AmmeMemoRadiSam system protein B [Aestuariirhabdus haliotis]